MRYPNSAQGARTTGRTMTAAKNADSSKFLTALKTLEDSLSANPDKRRISDAVGPDASPITAIDISYMVEALREKFDLDWSHASSELAQAQFDDLAPKIQYVTTNVAPNLHSNANYARSVLDLLYSIDVQLSALLSSSVIDHMVKLPIDTRRQLKTARKRIEVAFDSTDDLQEKVNEINSAYAAAQNLPTTQSDLEVVIADIEQSRRAVLSFEADAKNRADVAKTSQQEVEAVLAQANHTLARVNAAFRAATSEGLAREFKKKAFALNVSVALWTVVLFGALWGAKVIGSERFPHILKSTEQLTAHGVVPWELLVTQMLISILSLGAPVWLAWVATKQVGERFRLAEDYAYKAALSSAYEGYRTEAADLDPVLQAQLFSIAISRLDEIPLRLVDKRVSGSPMHELFQTVEFKRALDTAPGLRQRFLSIFARAQDGALVAGLGSPVPASKDDDPKE